MQHLWCKDDTSVKVVLDLQVSKDLEISQGKEKRKVFLRGEEHVWRHGGIKRLDKF